MLLMAGQMKHDFRECRPNHLWNRVLFCFRSAKQQAFRNGNKLGRMRAWILVRSNQPLGKLRIRLQRFGDPFQIVDFIFQLSQFRGVSDVLLRTLIQAANLGDNATAAYIVPATVRVNQKLTDIKNEPTD